MSDERRAPVQGYSAGIPWSLHLRAWDAYAAKYGRYQSAEGIAERSGFSVGELDVFVPGWRDEVSEIAKLRAEVARLRERITAVIVAVTSEPLPVGEPRESIMLGRLQVVDEIRAALAGEEVESS